MAEHVTPSPVCLPVCGRRALKKLLEHGREVRVVAVADLQRDVRRCVVGCQKQPGADSPVMGFGHETRVERLDRRELMRVWDDMRFYED